MTSMSELRAYKEAEAKLTERSSLLAEFTEAARIEWQETQGAPGRFDIWTEAIKRENETTSALFYISTIIREIEGANPDVAPKWLGVGHDPSGEQY